MIDPILNLLPFESSNIFLGFRSIFRISTEKRMEKATFIDVKLMAKIKVDNSDLFENQFFVIGDTQKLNLNSGFGSELNLTRIFGLPFISVKGYTASKDFINPTFSIATSDSSNDAYYSNRQFETTFALFWNGNTQLTSRFKFNFGIAFFDIWKASYNSANDVIYQDEEGKSYIVPVFGLYYSFVPSETPLLGGSLRVFDSRVTVGGWIKIFEFAPENVLRFEASAITEPLTRSLREWESTGGLFFQFRYRYGL